jgi:amino acid adenylation domain-containing protein
MGVGIKLRSLAALGIKKAAHNRSQRSAELTENPPQGSVDVLGFWKKLLSDPPALLDLPLDHIRPTERQFDESLEVLSANLSLAETVRTLCEQEECTAYVVLLTAYLTLLYRYTGQEDIIVATPFRDTEGLSQLQESEIDTGIVFIRGIFNDQMSFKDALNHINQSYSDIKSVGAAPLDGLLNALSQRPYFDQNALFQVAFDCTGNSAKLIEPDCAAAKPDLFLRVIKEDAGIGLRIDYDSELFESQTIQRLLGHYHNILVSAISDSTQSLSKINLLSDVERHQLLYEWNNTRQPIPQLNGIHELFEARTKAEPDATAIVFHDTNLTYQQLNAKANQLAHYLRSAGVGPGFLVGIYMDRCVDSVVAILGILKAGGTYLPLDASYPKERLKYILHDAKANLLITHEYLGSDLHNVTDKLLYLDTHWKQISAHKTDDLVVQSKSDHIAFVLYTSGSTGDPKGVEVTHYNLISYFHLWEYSHQISTTITSICQMTFFSFAVFQGDVVRALCSGKKLVLCSREVLMSPRKLFELMQQEKVDFAEFVPMLLRGLTNYVKEAGENLDFMKIIVVGADRWYLREHKDVERICGAETRVVHVYGSSETTLDSTYYTGTELDVPENQLVPIGKPFPNVCVYILDSHMQPVPIGVAGELYVGGLGIAKGYHNRPALTAEKFIASPYSRDSNDRLYSTGDFARFLSDGNIAFFGRRDQQVKVRGFRVELGEIEARMEQYPKIKAAIVQPWEPAAGVLNLVGYYVPNSSSSVTNDEMRLYLEDRLPDFMVPSRFVKLDSLPLTPSGKVNRKALPLPDCTGGSSSAVSQSVLSESQKIISDICCHALGVANLQAHDDFTSIGGDSMAIMTMVTGIENAFDITIEEEEINPSTFSSINSLTQFVESKM